ncbi:MAG TPA: hypothetical protein VHK90_07390 [Thermoanaerobaculia bacterium]|nr:hypothetical protein [Thermoanaerobaculia bacterium]
MTTNTEEAVLVFLKLSDDGFGEYEEREAIFDLEEKVEAAVKETGVGEYDGHEFGNGWGKLYVYGADARRLADIVLPIIRASAPRSGSYLVQRFGAPGAPEERVEL